MKNRERERMGFLILENWFFHAVTVHTIYIIHYGYGIWYVLISKINCSVMHLLGPILLKQTMKYYHGKKLLEFLNKTAIKVS